jgi:hypothetical protein
MVERGKRPVTAAVGEIELTVQLRYIEVFKMKYITLYLQDLQ